MSVMWSATFFSQPDRINGNWAWVASDLEDIEPTSTGWDLVALTTVPAAYYTSELAALKYIMCYTTYAYVSSYLVSGLWDFSCRKFDEIERLFAITY